MSQLAKVYGSDVKTSGYGETVDFEAWTDRKEKRQVLRDQTEALAAKLEQGGVMPYQAEGAMTTRVGLISGVKESRPTYRKINFLPDVARRSRNEQVASFECFMAENPNAAKYCRYWMLTSGQRVDVNSPSEVHNRLKWFHRRISKMASELRNHPVYPYDVILRTTEVELTRDRVPRIRCIFTRILRWCRLNSCRLSILSR